MSDYRKDVRDMAESIMNELRDEYKDGTTGEPLREWLIEHMHESIDGSARVIYTAQAKECVCESDNSGAMVENFGTDGVVQGGELNWSGMAYCAFEADVYEELGRLGLDVNSPSEFFEAEDEEAAEATSELGTATK